MEETIDLDCGGFSSFIVFYNHDVLYTSLFTLIQKNYTLNLNSIKFLNFEED